MVFKSVKIFEIRNIQLVLFIIEKINVDNSVENYENFSTSV